MEQDEWEGRNSNSCYWKKGRGLGTHQLMDVLVEVHIAQLPDAQEGGRSELRREGETRSTPECTSNLSGERSRHAKRWCSASLTELCPPATARAPQNTAPCSQHTLRSSDPTPCREPDAAPAHQDLDELLQPISWQSQLTWGGANQQWLTGDWPPPAPGIFSLC